MNRTVMKKKVVLLGDSSVGKTSLVRRFVVDKFDDRYIETIGCKVTKRELNVQKGGRTIGVDLIIWDLIGTAGYTAIHARSLAGVHGAILVADITRMETLQSLERYWIPILFKVGGSVPLVFVWNKVDLVGEEALKSKEIFELASRYNVVFERALPANLESAYLTSARTGENVERAFESLAHFVLSEGAIKDTRRERAERLLAGEIYETKDKSTLMDVSDALIVDFCRSYNDEAMAMTILRQQYVKAGVNVRNPTRESLMKLVDYLATVESSTKDKDTVARNRERRLQMLRSARD